MALYLIILDIQYVHNTLGHAILHLSVITANKPVIPGSPPFEYWFLLHQKLLDVCISSTVHQSKHQVPSQDEGFQQEQWNMDNANHSLLRLKLGFKTGYGAEENVDQAMRKTWDSGVLLPFSLSLSMVFDNLPLTTSWLSFSYCIHVCFFILHRALPGPLFFNSR